MIRLFIVVLALVLQGCSGVILGSALTGAYVLSSFSSVKETKEEYLLERKLNKEIDMILKLNNLDSIKAEALVLRKNIFLVGVAKNNSLKKYLLDYTSSKYHKYKIFDEIKVGVSRSPFIDFTIKQKIKTKLIFTNNVRYANYYFSVFGGEVTIIGYASDKYESTLVSEKISSTQGVGKIINYIEIKDLGD
jgi:osmotically-inducible protein OsmY